MMLPMGGLSGMVLAILFMVAVLFICYKIGAIGGGGAGTRRDENPIMFWMIFTILAAFTAILIFTLIWTLLGLPPPLAAR